MKKAILKTIRGIIKNKQIASLMVPLVAGKPNNHLFVKLLPLRTDFTTTEFWDAERDGINYRLYLNDYDDYMIFFNRDPEHRDYFDLAKEGFTVLDIGTNIGMSLLNFAKRNKTGKNYGFEPVPLTYSRALQNAQSNPLFNNVKLFNIALSDKPQQLYFQMPIVNIEKEKMVHSGGAYASQQQTENTITVNAITLDEWALQEQPEKIDFMKIDVEGFEINVLAGAKQTLAKYRPLMYIEINGKALSRQNKKPEELIELIKSLNYTITSYPDKLIYENMKNFENCYFDVLCTPT